MDVFVFVTPMRACLGVTSLLFRAHKYLADAQQLLCSILKADILGETLHLEKKSEGKGGWHIRLFSFCYLGLVLQPAHWTGVGRDVRLVFIILSCLGVMCWINVSTLTSCNEKHWGFFLLFLCYFKFQKKKLVELTWAVRVNAFQGVIFPLLLDEQSK